MTLLAALAVVCLVGSASAMDLRQKPAVVDLHNKWTQLAVEQLNRALKNNPYEPRARNVILFVGDGMGVSTVTAAGVAAGGAGHRFSFEEFPVVGLAKTRNADKMVPDSASTATALLTGVKTNFKVLGLDEYAPPGICDPQSLVHSRLSTIAQWAQDKGLSTGVVTNTRITHATPAALYARSGHRDWECDNKTPAPCVDIARQLFEESPGRHLHVVMGGGLRQLGVNTSAPDEDNTCVRTDGRNLVAEWLQLAEGRVFVSNHQELMAVDFDSTDRLIGIFSGGHMPYAAERTSEYPSLANMTTQAIRLLQKNSKGFFLLVESGRIDHAHHENYARLALREVVELDEAVRATLEIVDQRETLLVVTADHSHSFTMSGYPPTGADVMGLANSTGDVNAYETLSYANGPGYLMHRNGSEMADFASLNRSGSRFRSFSGVYLKQAAHGGEDVAVYATGPGARLLQGAYEQNFVAVAMGHSAELHSDDHSWEAQPYTAAAPASVPAGVLVAAVAALIRCLR